MARKRINRSQRNVNGAEHAYNKTKRGMKKVRGVYRGIRRRIRQPGSGLGQYTGWW
jgi:hypothetical protein